MKVFRSDAKRNAFWIAGIVVAGLGLACAALVIFFPGIDRYGPSGIVASVCYLAILLLAFGNMRNNVRLIKINNDLINTNRRLLENAGQWRGVTAELQGISERNARTAKSAIELALFYERVYREMGGRAAPPEPPRAH